VDLSGEVGAMSKCSEHYAGAVWKVSCGTYEDMYLVTEAGMMDEDIMEEDEVVYFKFCPTCGEEL
jgi:hypothetical protein